MAVYKRPLFGGETPRTTPKLLAPELAQAADNCYLNHGDLRPLPGNTNEATSGLGVKVQGLYRSDDGDFYVFPSDVDVVRSSITLNVNNRVYITGGGHSVPQWTDNTVDGAPGTSLPTVTYVLGIPNSTLAPAITPATAIPSDTINTEDRIYVWTWARAFNGITEEGGPSLPSIQVTVTPDTGLATDEPELNWTAGEQVAPVPAAGSYGGGAGTVWTKRVYRSVTGATGTELYYIGEAAMGAATFIDDKQSLEIQELLTTELYIPPPAGLTGITAMPNGIMVGFSGNELWFSVAYQPHAWPSAYTLATDYPIVAIAAFGESLAVATTGNPYIVTGVDPSAMSMGRLELAQSCVSKRSMVDMGAYVIYASPDGLVAIGPGYAKLITEGIYTRKQWQTLLPATMRAFLWEGKYVCRHSVGTTNEAIIFDPQAKYVTSCDFTYESGYNDLETDLLYVAGADATNIASFTTSASALTYVWRSKRETYPDLINFAAAQIIGEQSVGTPVTFRLFTNDDWVTPVFTGSITDREGFRLPATYETREFEYELEGTTVVEEVLLATSMSALREK